MRLRDLYGGSKETIYTPESKDSSISEKYTLQGKDAFLVLPEKILLDVGVAGLNLLHLISSHPICSPCHDYFLRSFLNSLVTMESFFFNVGKSK